MQILYEQKHPDPKPPKLSQIRIHIQYHLVTVKTKPPQLATKDKYLILTQNNNQIRKLINTNLNSENNSFQSRQPSTSQNKTKADYKAPPKAQNAFPPQPTAKQQDEARQSPKYLVKKEQ